MPLDVLQTPGDTQWFTHDRFGLFIHWGLYSQAARHEWVMAREKIPVEEYERKYFKRFDPDLYDPTKWAEAAAYAGMKYFVITTKHHEGFCLWDTKFTDYKITKTPYGKDVLKPMVKAFREAGLRTGFYHSLLDWHHPDMIIDKHIGPYAHLSDDERAKMNQGRDQKKYAKYLYNQTRELLTEFGQVDVLWYDFSYPKPDGTGKGKDDWESEKLYKLIRKLAPHVILDDRLDLPDGWDVKTPEQFQPENWVTVNGQKVVWEACQTMSGSWGYHRDESSWRDADQLIRTLIDCVAKGGNFLLNVGPTARGEFDERALNVLKGIGDWMHYHSRSIYGCTQAPAEFTPPPDVHYTYNPVKKRLYAHLFAWPYKNLVLPNLGGKVEYAQLLNDASEVTLKGLEDWQAHWSIGNQDSLSIYLPQKKPSVSIPVLELFLK